MDENKNTYSNNKLFEIVRKRDIVFLKQLIEKEKEICFNIKDINENYLIHYAILLNDITMLKLLIEHNTYIDILDENKRSILFTPIKYFYNELFLFLLEINKTHIGINVINLQDLKGMAPMHYSILFKNKYAFNALLENDADINVVTSQNQSCLHLACYTNQIDIVEILLKKNISLNITTNNEGETALMYSVKYHNVDIVKLLLKHNTQINIAQKYYDVTPILYSVYDQQFEIFKVLLEKIKTQDKNQQHININVQDIFGNTILHNIGIQLLYEFCNIIFSNLDKLNINFNLLNNQHKLPLHIFLKNKRLEPFYEILIEKTNLNVKNISGRTCLHIICKKNIWRKYKHILINKKLNIFIKSKKNIRPIDYIKQDLQEFIDIVILSMENRAKKKNISIKQYMKYLYDTDIKENLSKTIKNIISENKEHLKILFYRPKQELEFTTYLGISLDILSGLLYLKLKYPTTQIFLENYYDTNKNIIDYYTKNGFSIDENTEFLNMQIMYVNNVIFFPEKLQYFLYTTINKQIKENNTFAIIPLSICNIYNSICHSNLLLINLKNKQVERFDSNGANLPKDLNINEEHLDELIRNYFKDFTYISAKDYLPKIGIQQLGIIKQKINIGDPNGFCTLWGLFYSELRCINPDTPREKALKYIIEIIKSEDINTLIRNYSKNIIELRDNILATCGLTINKFINKEYSLDKLECLHKKIVSLLQHVKN